MRQRILAVLVCALLLLGIVCASVSVSSVTVTGNRSVSDEAIEDMVFPTLLSRNTLVCLFSSIRGKKKNIPFVQDYKVSLTSPVSAEILVYEKSIVGYVSYMSSRMYFDKDGIIVESAGHRLPGIPEVTGLRFGEIVLYRELPVENRKIFSMILNLTQTLSTYEIPADLIRYDSELNATLMIGDINVLLGSADDMNGKLSELANILPQIQGLSGTLDLSDYDPTVTNRMYSFRRH